MSRGRKALLSLLLVGAIRYRRRRRDVSAFSATTVNPGQQLRGRTVVISTTTANAAMYTIANATADGRVTRCIRVTYTGRSRRRSGCTRPGDQGRSDVRDVVIDKGTMTVATAFPNCIGSSPTRAARSSRHARQLRDDPHELP